MKLLMGLSIIASGMLFTTNSYGDVSNRAPQTLQAPSFATTSHPDAKPHCKWAAMGCNAMMTYQECMKHAEGGNSGSGNNGRHG
jgi:hypothetical protein